MARKVQVPLGLDPSDVERLDRAFEWYRAKHPEMMFLKRGEVTRVVFLRGLDVLERAMAASPVTRESSAPDDAEPATETRPEHRTSEARGKKRRPRS